MPFDELLDALGLLELELRLALSAGHSACTYSSCKIWRRHEARVRWAADLFRKERQQISQELGLLLRTQPESLHLVAKLQPNICTNKDRNFNRVLRTSVSNSARVGNEPLLSDAILIKQAALLINAKYMNLWSRVRTIINKHAGCVCWACTTYQTL